MTMFQVSANAKFISEVFAEAATNPKCGSGDRLAGVTNRAVLSLALEALEHPGLVSSIEALEEAIYDAPTPPSEETELAIDAVLALFLAIREDLLTALGHTRPNS